MFYRKASAVYPLTRTFSTIGASLILFAGLTLGVQDMRADAPASNGQATELTLVRDGRPQATLVVSRTKSLVVEFAVKELNDHIEKISGARLPVVTDDQPVAGPRVLLGDSEATRALGLNRDDFEDQEYLVRATGDTLVLLGKDVVSPPIDDSARNLWIDGKWGKALSFHGDMVFTASDHGFDDAEGTLECWLYVDNRAEVGTILRLSKDDDHVILLREGRRVRYRSFHAGRENFLLSQELSTGWHHVMATHSETTQKIELFLDGRSQGTAPYVKTAVADSPLFIGGYFAANLGSLWIPLHGAIDEIRVSKTVRADPPSDQPFTSDASTTLLLHLDEGEGVPAGTATETSTQAMARLPDLYGNAGTLYAVYDFLERCGVRWYAPGKIGLVAPQAPTILVPPIERRRTPTMRYRVYCPSDVMTDGGGTPASRCYETQLWLRRLRTGGEPACNGTHSLFGYYDRFSRKFGKNPSVFEQDRPEFFAQGLSDDQMNAAFTGGGMPNLCYSSPELAAQVIQDARDYFDGKGMKPGASARGDYFAVAPMDMAPYCKCAACEAQLADEPGNTFFRGQRSNYWFRFVNRVAEGVAESHPGKRIITIAYYDWVFHPTDVKLAPNVTVQLCLYSANWWGPAWKRRDMRVFDEWTTKEQGRPLYLWLWYLADYPWPNSETNVYFPPFFAHTAVEQMKMFHAAGIRGVFLENNGEIGLNFLYDQLESYVTLKLADDPTLDGNEVLREFFALFYGASAEPMGKLYGEIEQAYRNTADYPEEVRTKNAPLSITRKIAQECLATPERMARWATYMADAKAKAATDLERRRVAWFESVVWRKMSDERDLYAR